MLEKIAKTENAICCGTTYLFTFFAFLACPVLAYHKFNTRTFNERSTQLGHTIKFSLEMPIFRVGDVIVLTQTNLCIS